MKLRFNLRQFLLTLLLFSAIFGFLLQRSYVRRVATRQLFDSGFSLAYKQSAINRTWSNEGGWGLHQPVNKPANSFLDIPSDQVWLSCLGLIELANEIQVVHGSRTWLDKKKFKGFVNDELKPLQKLRDVRELSLNWNSITDDGLKHLSNLSRLERLELDGCDVSDEGLKKIKHLKNIEHLSLAFTNVSDRGLLLLSMTNLTFLDLNGTNVTSESLKLISKSRELKYLNLSGTKIGQANIEFLCELKKLEELHIEDTEVDDLRKVVGNLPNLRELFVDGTRLGDDLIDALQGSTLYSLSVDRTQVSQKSVVSIQNLNLTYFSGEECGLTLEQLESIEDHISSR